MPWLVEGDDRSPVKWERAFPGTKLLSGAVEWEDETSWRKEAKGEFR